MANGAQEAPTTVVVQPASTALQLGAQSLGQVTSALGAQPIMLTVVLLNVVFACIAGYFLLQLETFRAQNLASMIDLMRECIVNTTPVASQESKKAAELEALIESNKAEMQRNKNEIERLRGQQTTP
jgi:uncharacterized protein HemX